MRTEQWKLVPVEPTEEMLRAMETQWMCGSQADMADREYRAMLAAAPDAPSAEPVYAYRRKGFDDFCTCDEARYIELSQKPTLFETAFFYALPPDAAAIIARLRAKTLEQAQDIRDLIGIKDDNAKLRSEVEQLQISWHAQCESADKLFALNAQQAERIAAQSAALAKAKEALEGVCDSDEECQDSDGWTAAVISFEALHEAQEALEAIAQLAAAKEPK